MYQLYENGCYGFSMYYPKVVSKDPPPTNGDGARFYSEEFELTAYASHTNVINDEEDLNSITEEIAYQRLTADWYVISYEENGNIIYKKFYFNDQVALPLSFPIPLVNRRSMVQSHLILQIPSFLRPTHKKNREASCHDPSRQLDESWLFLYFFATDVMIQSTI